MCVRSMYVTVHRLWSAIHPTREYSSCGDYNYAHKVNEHQGTHRSASVVQPQLDDHHPNPPNNFFFSGLSVNSSGMNDSSSGCGEVEPDWRPIA